MDLNKYSGIKFSEEEVQRIIAVSTELSRKDKDSDLSDAKELFKGFSDIFPEPILEKAFDQVIKDKKQSIEKPILKQQKLSANFPKETYAVTKGSISSCFNDSFFIGLVDLGYEKVKLTIRAIAQETLHFEWKVGDSTKFDTGNRGVFDIRLVKINTYRYISLGSREIITNLSLPSETVLAIFTAHGYSSVFLSIEDFPFLRFV